jgi:hypothetical protein
MQEMYVFLKISLVFIFQKGKCQKFHVYGEFFKMKSENLVFLFLIAFEKTSVPIQNFQKYLLFCISLSKTCNNAKVTKIILN